MNDSAPAASARASRPDTGRVAAMHHHTRRGLLVSGLFAVGAIATAVIPNDTGAWLPLHLFLLGSVTIAIATVTQMLAVTWSAAPPPPRRALALQRWGLATGVVLVIAGREWSNDPLTIAGAMLVGGCLGAVTVILLRVRATARTPRFAPAIDAYVLAFISAIAGVVLGVGLSTGTLGSRTSSPHVLINLFAFVGVVVAGTLPYFAATQARTKMSPLATPTHLRAVTAVLWVSAVVAAIAAARRDDTIASLAIITYGVGVVALATLLPGTRRKQIGWAGPRLIQLFAGIGWWIATTTWIGITYATSGIDRDLLLALVIGGYAQILASSFAYLVPVVRGGGHEQLSAGFRRTRSWAGLALGNAAAVAAWTGEERLMTLLLGLWVIDGSVRSAFRPPPRPSSTATPGASRRPD